MIKRKVAQSTKEFIKDIDYWNKLSEDDTTWYRQFLLEYYQGDFNNDESIHPDELRTDCYTRNNMAKRQLHSVSTADLHTSMVKASKQASKTDSRFYNPLDYGGPDGVTMTDSDVFEDVMLDLIERDKNDKKSIQPTKSEIKKRERLRKIRKVD